MTTDPNCIFCKIIKGDIPTFKVYEDDNVLAILDIRPVTRGHTLVIPKIHIDHFMDLPDSLAADIVKVGNQISRRLRDVVRPDRVGVVVAGYGVAHVHYHVIPMQHTQDITSRAYAFIEDGQIQFDAMRPPIASEEDRREMVQEIGLI